MQKDVLVVLINTTSLDSSLECLEEIEKSLKNTCEVLLVDNGSIVEDDLRMRHNDFSCVSEYINLPDTYNSGMVLNKITPSLIKYPCKKIFFVIEDHKKTISHLPVLLSMSYVSKNDILGIRGGSVFSAFFYNLSFFQKYTHTEWLDLNGMLIPMSIWRDQNMRLDLRYYKEFFQVDFGFQLRRSGYKLFKLKPYKFLQSIGLNNYFRMRNPFLFMRINYNFNKYLLGVLYFLFQLPYAIYKSPKNKNFLIGLFDGIKLLYFKIPSDTS